MGPAPDDRGVDDGIAESLEVVVARIVTGLALIALGVLFLLDRAGVVDTGAVVADWWPLVLVAIGLGQLVESRFRGNNGLTTLVVGLVLLGFTTGALTGELVAVLWPVALILVGLWILGGRLVTRRPPPAVATDVVDDVVVFAGKEVPVTSQGFRGGRATAVFGAIDLDLRLARLHPEGAVLSTAAVFGGVEVEVPSGWRVEMSGPAVFGGWENKALPAADDAPLLVVKAIAVFGGVEVVGDPAVVGDPSSRQPA